MSVESANVLAELRRLANPTNVAGMARFGIVGQNLLGISVVQLRAIAKRTGRDHAKGSRAARWIAGDALRELQRWKAR